MIRRRNPTIVKTGRYIKIIANVATKRSEEKETANLGIWTIHEVIEYGKARSYGAWVMGCTKPFFLMKYLYKKVDKPKFKIDEKRTEKTIVRRRHNDSRIPQKRKRRKTDLPVKRSRRIH